MERHECTTRQAFPQTPGIRQMLVDMATLIGAYGREQANIIGIAFCKMLFLVQQMQDITAPSNM